MKKLIYLISILAFTISSCSKSGDFNFQLPLYIPISIDYQLGDTISAFVNGTSTSFIHSEQVKLSGNYHIHISGADNGNAYLDLDIESPYPITSGTFTENAVAGNPIAAMKYTWYDPSGWRYAVPFHSTANPVTIIITSIDSVAVKGTFNGDLRFISNSGSSIIKSIRNGVFNVKF